MGKYQFFSKESNFSKEVHLTCIVLYWVENAPKLDEDGEDAVCEFIDKYVSCAVPSDNEDLDLRDVILAVQQQSRKHSKSCMKRGTDCRFNFPRPPSVCTFINSPNDEDNLQDDAEATDLKQEQSNAKEILLRVWNEEQDGSNESENTEDILKRIDLTQEQYIDAHRKLAKKGQLFLKETHVSFGSISTFRAF